MKFRVHLNLSSVTKPVIPTLKMIATFILPPSVHTQDLGQTLEVLDTCFKLSEMQLLGLLCPGITDLHEFVFLWGSDRTEDGMILKIKDSMRGLIV